MLVDRLGRPIVERSGGDATAFARREVILCAGALQSPQLLQLSGVGSPALLRQLTMPATSGPVRANRNSELSSTGITDLVLDPNNPNMLYAAFWQAWRTPWQLVSGGAGSGRIGSGSGGFPICRCL